VRKVAEEHIDGIARCFDDALAQSSEGAGADRGVQAVLNMTIDAQGLVSAASVESDAGERLKECLVTEAKAWKFAPPQGTVKVRYPLSFQPPR
jgi:hypothetical protein